MKKLAIIDSEEKTVTVKCGDCNWKREQKTHPKAYGVTYLSMLWLLNNHKEEKHNAKNPPKGNQS